MTIDEHIKHIQGTIEWAKAFGGKDDDNLIIMWAEQLEMLEELQWYREQDLIRREDVIPIPIYCTHGMGECSVIYTCPKCWEETIMQIQKVEYGSSK